MQQHFLHNSCRYCDELRDDMTLSAVMISNTTSRLSYSAQIVHGQKGQNNQCLLSAGQYLNSQLWFVAGWGRIKSFVMNLPVHGVTKIMLHMITVTPCT